MKEKFSLIVSEIDTALQKIDESQIEDLVQSILQGLKLTSLVPTMSQHLNPAIY